MQYYRKINTPNKSLKTQLLPESPLLVYDGWQMKICGSRATEEKKRQISKHPITNKQNIARRKNKYN